MRRERKPTEGTAGPAEKTLTDQANSSCKNKETSTGGEPLICIALVFTTDDFRQIKLKPSHPHFFSPRSPTADPFLSFSKLRVSSAPRIRKQAAYLSPPTHPRTTLPGEHFNRDFIFRSNFGRGLIEKISKSRDCIKFAYNFDKTILIHPTG